MKIKDVLKNAEKLLDATKNPNSFYEARCLLSFVLDRTKEWIMLHINDEILSKDNECFFELVNKRVSGFPLQYIIGMCCFLGNDFFVNENVLIPRSDTEVWVEEVIKCFKGNDNVHILDVCTGSGCIAISLKKELKNAYVRAVDISYEALTVAKKNAELNKVNVEFVQSDLFEKLGDFEFDVIVSNPPYIPRDDIKNLDKDVLNEPVIALDGGVDGLDFYRKIAVESKKFLKDKGLLFLEFGYNQADSVCEILRNSGFIDLEVIKDYSGNTRAVKCMKG